MDLRKEFIGNLYKGDSVSKSWSVIGKGNMALSIAECTRSKKWRIDARKDRQKVWEYLIDDTFSHKLRDNFVQWSHTDTTTKEKLTYGFRIKEASLAQEFADNITYAVNSSPANERSLNITLPSKRKIELFFKRSTTMANVLKHLTSQNNLEHSQYALAALTKSGSQLNLRPQMTVNDLESSEIIIIRRHKPTAHAETSATAPAETKSKEPLNSIKQQIESISVTVNVPDGSAVGMDVDPNITLLELLKQACMEKGLNPSFHKFDLLIANQDKIRLKQLKMSLFSLIRKEGIDTETTDGGPGSNLRTKFRVAPPPPKSPISNPHKSAVKTSSSPSTRKQTVGTESTDSGYVEDTNDLVSRMLQQQAITRSPSRDPAKRKLNPAPPPPQGGSKLPSSPQRAKHPAPPPPTGSNQQQKHVKRVAPAPPKDSPNLSKLREEVDGSQHHQHHVKRVAPPPPRDSPNLTTRPQETVVSNDAKTQQQNKMPKPHGGVPLPSMVMASGKAQPKGGTPQEVRKKSPPTLAKIQHSHSADKADNYTPTLQRSSQSDSSSPHRKPLRKAPEKPLASPTIKVESFESPKEEGIPSTSNGQVPSQHHAATDAPRESQTVPNAFTFKFPPPPPKKTITKQEQVVEESSHKTNIPIDTRTEDHLSDDEKSIESSQSSTCGGYNIGSAEKAESSSGSDQSETASSDGEDATATEQSEDESESNESDSCSETDSDDENESAEEANKAAETEERNKPAKKDPKKPSSSSLVPEPESSSDEEMADGEILLISHTVTEQPVEPPSNHDSTASQLPLDDKITSLRNLIADTCELGGKDQVKNQDSIGSETDFDLTSIKKMGPPLDTSTKPEAASPPSAPPLPPIMHNQQAPPTAPKPKPPPPAVKPKPHPHTAIDMEDELAKKLKRRQQMIEETNNESHIPPGRAAPLPNTSTGFQSVPHGITPSTSVTGVGGVSAPGGGDMQAQLQMLQQQMLQQQMMQLQQQFQQLQSLIVTNPSSANTLLMQQQMQQMQQLQAQAQPLGMGMGVGGMGMGIGGMGMGAGGMVSLQPQQLMMNSLPQSTMPPDPSLIGAATANPSLLMANQPVMTQPQQMYQPMTGIAGTTATVPGMVPGMPGTAAGGFMPAQMGGSVGIIPPASSPPVVSVTPPPTSIPSVLPPPPPPPISSDDGSPAGKGLSRRPSEADVRMKALGRATKSFDNLMGQVRDVNPTELLKKVPETEKEQHVSTVYTGMTAAIAQAMKDRRKSFQDPNAEQSRESIDWEET